MLKLGRMRRQTGKTFVAPTAMSRQMRKVSDFQSLQPFNNLVLSNTLALTDLPEDGHGAAQMVNTTNKLITSWRGSASDQLISIEQGASLE